MTVPFNWRILSSSLSSSISSRFHRRFLHLLSSHEFESVRETLYHWRPLTSDLHRHRQKRYPRDREIVAVSRGRRDKQFGDHLPRRHFHRRVAYQTRRHPVRTFRKSDARGYRHPDCEEPQEPPDPRGSSTLSATIDESPPFSTTETPRRVSSVPSNTVSAGAPPRPSSSTISLPAAIRSPLVGSSQYTISMSGFDRTAAVCSASGRSSTFHVFIPSGVAGLDNTRRDGCRSVWRIGKHDHVEVSTCRRRSLETILVARRRQHRCTSRQRIGVRVRDRVFRICSVFNREPRRCRECDRGVRRRIRRSPNADRQASAREVREQFRGLGNRPKHRLGRPLGRVRLDRLGINL